MANLDEIKVKLTVDTNDGSAALQKFDELVNSTIRKLSGYTNQDIGIIKRLAVEVDQGKRKLEEIPEQYRKIVSEVTSSSRNIRLVDTDAIKQASAQIKAEVDRIKARYDELRDSGRSAQDALTQAAVRTRDALGGMHSGVMSVSAALQGLLALGAAGGIVAMADAMTLLTGRLTVAEGSASAAHERLQQLSAIAGRTGTDVSSAADSYARMSFAIRNVGGSTEQALKFSEALGLSLRLSGATAEETSAVMRQLSQALQKGKLNGDEFVSVAENGGRVLDYLAVALGTTRGGLLEMSHAGTLTSDKLLKLGDQLTAIRADAGNLSDTFGISVTRLTNAAKLWVSESTGVQITMQALSTLVSFAAQHFDGLVQTMMLAAGGVIVARIGAIVEGIKALTTALLGAHVAINPYVGIVVGLVTAFALLHEPVVKLWGSLNSGIPVLQDITQRLGELRNTLQSVNNIAVTAGKAVQDAIDAEIKKAADLIKQLGSDYQQLSADIKAQLTDRLHVIDEHYKRQKAIIDAAHKAEYDKVRESVDAVIAASTDKVSAIRMEASRMQVAWKETYGIAVTLAQETGQQVTETERQSVQARLAMYEQIAAGYRSVVDGLIAEEQRYLQAAADADARRISLKSSVEDTIRDLHRQTMSHYEAYQDKMRQIDELQAQARDELARGNFTRAKELAEQSIALAKASAQAVTDTVTVAGKDMQVTMVSGSKAAAAAIDQIKESADIADQALQQTAESSRNMASRLDGEVKTATQSLQEAVDKARELRESLSNMDKMRLDVDMEAAEQSLTRLQQLWEAQEWIAKIQADTRAAEATLKELQDKTSDMELVAKVVADTGKVAEDIETLRAKVAQYDIQLPVNFDAAYNSLEAFRKQLTDKLEQPTTSTHTPQVDMSQYRAAVAELEQPTSSTHTIYVRRVETDHAGGVVGASVARYASGGLVRSIFRPMRSGMVPGVGDRDTVPRLLPQGAYVVRKDAVRKYGVGMLERLSRGGLIRGFASGGYVSLLKDWWRKKVEGDAPRMATAAVPWISKTQGQQSSTTDGLDYETYLRMIESGQIRGRQIQEMLIKVKKNKDVFEALQIVELGAAQQDAINRQFIFSDPGAYRNRAAEAAKEQLEKFLYTKELSVYAKKLVDDIKRKWEGWLYRDTNTILALEKIMEENRAYFYRLGGLAKSDTVMAMLTPGEYVVSRDAVQRYGVGLMDAINRMRVPATVFASRAISGIRGFASGGYVADTLLPPSMPVEAGSKKTIRVELAAGRQTVAATIDAQDETRLLQILETASRRAA